MSQLSKVDLKAENQLEFPNNNTGQITPANLRKFNVDMIDSTVNQTFFDGFSGSVASDINALEAFSQSLTTNFVSSASFAAYSQSVGVELNTIEGDIIQLQNFSTSLDTNFVNQAELAAATGSLLETASLSGGTLTFTKGDNSTFDLNLPTASITASYGSFAQSTAAVLANSASTNINFDTTLYSSLVSLSGSNAIQVTEPGIYDIDLNLNGVTNPTATTIQYGAWLYKNDVAISGSLLFRGPMHNTGQTIPNGYQWGWQVMADAGDTFRFGLMKGGTQASVTFSPANANYTGSAWNNNLVGTPNIYPIVANINRVDVGGLSSGSYTNIQALNQYTASNDQKWNTLGSQTGSFVTTSSFNAYTQSTDSRLSNIESATASFVTETESGSFLITASFASQTLTFTKGDNTTFSFIIPDVSGSTIDTGSFATTGSNTFRGNETFEDAGGNASTLVPTSGSLMLVAKTFTSASSHLTASANNFVNIIFKNNNNTGNTVISGSNNIFTNPSAPTAGFRREMTSDNWVNGTGAIMQLSASMAYPITNSNNIFLNPTTHQMRGPVSSSAWTYQNNIIHGNITLGTSGNPIVNMVAGATISGNINFGTIQFAGHPTNLLKTSVTYQRNFTLGTGAITFGFNSSSMAISNNIILGAFGSTVTNNSFSGSAGTGVAANFIDNIIHGNSNTITYSGQRTTGYTPVISGNALIGGYNDLHLDTTSGKILYQAILLGNELSVSGSNIVSDPIDEFGTVFVGRYNVNDGVRNTSRENIFVVGTGNANETKNGLLIDSASNMFVEGTFNMSGSSNFNGNVIITGSLTASLATGFTYVGDGTGRTTAVSTASFASVINTGSFVTTASFSNSTRDITFTKGDSSTFSFGGFATTGSNTGSNSFIGDQSFNTVGGYMVDIFSGADYTPNRGLRVRGDYGKIHINGVIDTYFLMTAGAKTFAIGGNNVLNYSAIAQNGTSSVEVYSDKWKYLAPVYVSSSFTASLQSGYTWVGDGSGTSIAVSTSSFASIVNTGSFVLTSSFDSFSASVDSRLDSLEAATSSYITAAQTASMTVGTASLAQFAQDIIVTVKNTTGTQINKGTVVRITGATGDNALIGTASWTSDAQSANTLGITYENIANDGFGRVITQGTLVGIDTSNFTAGQLLFLSSSGQITNQKVPAPFHEVRLGQVLRVQQNNGSMYVLIQNGYELTELHDVDINTSSLANNDLLAYDSASDQWTNKTLTGVGGLTTSSFNAISGTFATTGSNVFTGSQTINGGQLRITNGLAAVINGEVFISSSFGTPRLTVSGSGNQIIIENDSIELLSSTGPIRTNIIPAYIANYRPNTFDEIGLTSDPTNVNAGISGWTIGPALYTNDPSDAYPAMIGFQNKANWTDGRITALKSFIVSGSLDVRNTFTASLAQGFTYVGDANGRTTLVATSSFNTATGSFLTTGSVTGNVLTFTKGDASTFQLTVATGSGGGAAFPYTGDAVISGSLQVTGSMRGNVGALTVASSTASISMTDGNFFTLTLPTGSTTRVEFTNIRAGQTINLQVTQGSTNTGSIAFASNILFAGGFDYTATAITGAIDLLSFVTFNTSSVIATAVKNLL